ncbi:hypothetical protein [Aquisphaera giovannonii]|uniref:hypothetical protein n=1 Tax=Aquisphaera giovannonii TaxID=406548 RepID=UPI0011E02B3C|nr:hypothetical protein [Aquisphaera giovannonii]
MERRSSTALNALLTVCGSLLVPLLAAVLVIGEWISLAGFAILVAAGVVASLLLIDRSERRSRTTREVPCGKKAAEGPGGRDPRVFPETVGLPLLVAMSLGLVGLALILTIPAALGPGRPGRPASPLLAIPAGICVVVIWASQVRLIVAGDEVRTSHPWLRLVKDRACRFGDIDTVETREVGRGGWQVTIKPHHGPGLTYRSTDRATIDALLAALSEGVASSKPRSADLGELL